MPLTLLSCNPLGTLHMLRPLHAQASGLALVSYIIHRASELSSNLDQDQDQEVVFVSEG